MLTLGGGPAEAVPVVAAAVRVDAAAAADAAFSSKDLLLIEVQNFNHSEKSWK